MNKKSKVLQTEFSAGEYLAPKVKVVNLMGRRMLCTSDPYGTTSGTEESDYD